MLDSERVSLTKLQEPAYPVALTKAFRQNYAYMISLSMGRVREIVFVSTDRRYKVFVVSLFYQKRFFL